MNISIKKGIYYRKSLVMILIVASLSIAAVGVINYVIGTRQIKEEVSRTHSMQLEQTFMDVDRKLMHLENIATEWAFNPIFSGNLKNIDLGVSFERTNEIYAELRIIQGSSPLIHDVLLYVDNVMGDVLVSYSDGLSYIEDRQQAEFYRTFLEMKGNYLWTETSGFKRGEGVISKTLVQKIPGSFAAPYGALVFFIDKKVIDETINQLDLSGEGTAFILDEDGDWITDGGKKGASEMLAGDLKDEIAKENHFSASFTYNADGASYLVTYETMSKNGWKFVIATPLSRLLAPVLLMSRLILVSCIFVLLFAAAISVFASGNIYKPIDRLLDVLNGGAADFKNKPKDEIKYIEESWNNISIESRQLRKKLELNQDFLKKSFLLQLIQGHLYFLPAGKLNERFEQYWWKPENKIFSVLFFRFSGYCSEDTNFQKGDEQLVSFAAANIAEEITGESGLEAAVINFYDLSLAILVSSADTLSREEIKASLFRFSGKLSEVLSSVLKVKVAAVVSRQTGILAEISKVLDEARQALSYRDINKKAQIIDMESLIPNNDNQCSYPFAIEKNILDCLRMGLEVEAEEELEKFLAHIKSSSGNEQQFKQALFQLLGSILRIMVKAGASPNTSNSCIELYEELGKMNETDEILNLFRRKILHPYIREVLNAREHAARLCVNKVLERMEKDYNTPISLEICADELGMTSYNLSRDFKLYTGVNFIDYLTELRLKKAKELLSDSDLTVNEIAERVGYQPTYFVRIFKKAEGITPGQFRSL